MGWAWDTVGNTEIPYLNNVELKSMQVNLLKKVTRMIKRSDGVRNF